MYRIPGPLDLKEGDVEPKGLRKYAGICVSSVANLGAAIVVLGIVLLMRVAGKETRY